jgi:S-adenosylmethionine hydrolase
MKAVLAQQAPQQPVIDLMHDAPAFNPHASAYLLASLVNSYPKETVFLTIVDPGVGTQQRRPCVLKAEGRWFVGPDNGLFNVIARQSTEYQAWVIDWQPDSLSTSFHGRDLFAPVAAQLVLGQSPEMTETTLADDPEKWGLDLPEIIYLDSFGNAMTGLRGEHLNKGATLMLNDTRINYARVFSEAKTAVPFWYVNSNGLVEIAMKQASVAQSLGLNIGTPFQVI